MIEQNAGSKFVKQLYEYCMIVARHLSITRGGSGETLFDYWHYIYGTDSFYEYTDYWGTPEAQKIFRAHGPIPKKKSGFLSLSERIEWFDPKTVEAAVGKDPRILADPRIQLLIWFCQCSIKEIKSHRRIYNPPEFNKDFRWMIELTKWSEKILKAIARGLFPKE